MNTKLLTILVSGASALAGAAAGYFFCKKRLEMKYEQLYNDKLNEELKRIAATRKPLAQQIIEEATPAETVDRGEKADKASDYTHYSRYYKVNPADNSVTEMPVVNLDGEKDDDEEPVNDDPMEAYHDVGPEVVSLAEYSALPPYFEFLTFHYYEEDDILLDDQDTIVDDVDGVVGVESLTMFGDRAFDLSGEQDDNTVYVVNGKMMIAVEIVRVHGAYQDYIGV